MNPSRPPQSGYPYQPLQSGEIRLLRISQDAGHDLICHLEVANISYLPPYEALSYCWGDASDKIAIDCNGSQGLAITRNLHAALLALRLPTQERLLWADAICINQDDIEERGSQVLLMKDIYRIASSVVIWLGGSIDVDGTDIWPIPPLLEAARKNLARDELPIRHSEESSFGQVLKARYKDEKDLKDKRWNSIVKSLILLINRPWFLRVWVIQEVALATKAEVICGTNSTSWEDFYRVVSYAIDLGYFSSTLPEAYSSIQHIERVRQNFARNQYLRPLDHLASFRNLLATDSRDKVFGLYSLFSPSDLVVLELQPDYNLDLARVYTQSVLDCIATEGSLDVLSFGGLDALPEHSESNLPTWVPDWAFQDHKEPILPRFMSSSSFGGGQVMSSWKSATGSGHPIVEVSEDSTVIKLSGYVFDKVLETGGVLETEYYESQPSHPLLDFSTIGNTRLDLFEKWEEMCGVASNTPYCTGEAPWDVYRQTLFAGSFPHGDEQQTRDVFEKWYSIYQETQNLAQYGDRRWKEIEASESAKSLKMVAKAGVIAKAMCKGFKMSWDMAFAMNKIPQARLLAFNRTFLKTERGFVGISSPDVQQGDSIALFQGGKMPLVIREYEEGHWQIIADAYIHGVMKGEEFDRSKCRMISIY